MPDPAVVTAAVAGIRNVLRWAGMLEGEAEPVTGIKVVDAGFPCRRRSTPRVRQACIVRHLLQPGDLVKKGDPVAELRDVWGRPTGEKTLYSEYDGWVIGRSQGIAYYPGAEIYGMAIRDELPAIHPYPQGFWKK
jgi:predicted deacylase